MKRTLAAAMLALALAPTTAEAATRRVDMGDSLTLRGQSRGEKLRVRVYDAFLPTVPPVEEGDLFPEDQPSEGKRWYALRISFKATGRSDVDEAPLNGGRLITGAGRILRGTVESHSECDTEAIIQVPRRETRRFCMLFEIPAGAAPVKFQLRLSSGFGPDTGQWRLPRL